MSAESENPLNVSLKNPTMIREITKPHYPSPLARAAPWLDKMFNKPVVNPTTTEPTDLNPMRDEEARFIAYLARMKMIAIRTAKANIRFTAYSSDFGEAFRPVLPAWAVTAAYGVVGVYVLADIGYEAKAVSDNGG